MYYWEEGLTLPIVDNCPECNGFYREDRSHKKPRFDQRPRGPIIREREREVMIDASLYMISWGAGFQCMIGWGTGPCYVILQEGGFLLMSELNKLLLLEFQMSTHIVGIQRESLFMITLIGHGNVQMV